MDEELQLEASQVTGNNIQTSMAINGIDYTTICDCSAPELAEEQDVKCAPTTLSLTQEQEGEGASLEEVEDKLVSANYTYVEVSKSSFRCLDGRITQGILGTPGGDAGEFILGLLVYEDLTGKRLDKESVELYLEEYLECMEHNYFYWCTDDEAVSYAEKELGVEGINILDPRESLRSELLGLLAKPSAVGDLHIKNMLSYPELYSVNTEVVEIFIGVFYEYLWEGDLAGSLYLEVLPGEHNETAFLEVKTDQACQVLKAAPLVVPREGNSDNLSVFVNHLDSVKTRRMQLASFFAEKIGKNQDGITTERFLNRMNHHGYLFLDATGSLVASELPFYTASFEN